jgi:DNA uptake protein ComE-like DNA-binding protein
MKTESLYFTKRERKGVFLLSFLLIVSWTIPWFFPLMKRQVPEVNEEKLSLIASWQKKKEAEREVVRQPFFLDPNKVSYDSLLLWGISARLAQTWVNYREKVSLFREKEDLLKVYGMNKKLFDKLKDWIKISGEKEEKSPEGVKKQVMRFAFNPNSLSKDSLNLLGLPSKVVRNILKYRAKGGRFYKSEDLLKIYGLSEELYQQLAGLIRLPENENRFTEKVTASTDDRGTVQEHENRPAVARAKEMVPLMIDINQATEEDWQKLRGIGPYFASRIVRFRMALGGFLSIDQVAETYHLPDSTFQAIRPHLKWSPVQTKLPINQVDEERLAQHPYISRRLAKALVGYREQHGPFQSQESLKKVQALSAEEMERILPYFSVE